ncbi:MAG: hypothetical protein GXO66_09780 [Euryarchaeota archaeon]|nr:hypothetical protein [Euryarchaeota archaeon]
MRETGDVEEQVRLNCEISNANFWGIYSICGLLMRLRSLYRFEHSMKPWERIDSAGLMEWIGAKERLWQSLRGREIEPLRIGGRAIDAFDVAEVERHLPAKLCYGAGYATAMKPSFFLGELAERRVEQGFAVYVVERERVRDLLAVPAMQQGRRIYLRMQVFREYLWDKVEELRMGGASQALREAFAHCGVPEEQLRSGGEELAQAVERIAREESYTLIAHELGEALEDEFPEELWHELASRSPFLERLVRGLRDILADTHERGMLSAIVARQRIASLAFYVASLSGFRRELFPEVREAYEEAKRGRWGAVEEAARRARERVLGSIRTLQEITSSAGDRDELWLRRRVQKELLQPLGINL